MPIKRFNKKKKFIKRRRYKPKMKLAKPLKPGKYYFKRAVSTVIPIMNATTLGWTPNDGATTLAKNFVFTLNDLTDKTDFTNLFLYYKINAVRVKIWFSTTLGDADPVSRQFGNSQLLVRYDLNKTGRTLPSASSEQTYLDSQTSKTKVCIVGSSRPIDFLMRVKQNVAVKDSVANYDYVPVKPRFIPTTEVTTAHYGLQMMLQRVDGGGFTTGFSNQQLMRCEYTYYIECSKVQ